MYGCLLPRSRTPQESRESTVTGTELPDRLHWPREAPMAATGSDSALLLIDVLMNLGPARIAVMRSIKKALDPDDILNPGKIFDA